MGLLSKKITKMKESATLAMARKSRELQATGKKIINNQIDPNSIRNEADYIINNNEQTLLTPKIIRIHHLLNQL